MKLKTGLYYPVILSYATINYFDCIQLGLYTESLAPNKYKTRVPKKLNNTLQPKMQKTARQKSSTVLNLILGPNFIVNLNGLSGTDNSLILSLVLSCTLVFRGLKCRLWVVCTHLM